MNQPAAQAVYCEMMEMSAAHCGCAKHTARPEKASRVHNGEVRQAPSGGNLLHSADCWHATSVHTGLDNWAEWPVVPTMEAEHRKAEWCLHCLRKD